MHTAVLCDLVCAGADLASSPCRLSKRRGRKGDPGTHCLRMHVPDIWEFVFRSVFFRVSHFAELIEFCSSSPLSVFFVTCSYEEAYSLNAEG